MEINEEKERFFLYLGDELGFIKAWDLTYLITNLLPIVRCT
jgi:hypothetical protein